MKRGEPVFAASYASFLNYASLLLSITLIFQECAKKKMESKTFEFRQIGIVSRNATDEEVKKSWELGLESRVEVFPEYEEGLEGLAGFSHIFVIGYFHKLREEQKGPLQVRPRGLLRYGLSLEELPLVGVFALDSPTRPNPLGLSLAKLLRVEDRRKLVVSGLDFFDGTPVLDIKPYQNSYHTEHFALPAWHTELVKKAGHV